MALAAQRESSYSDPRRERGEPVKKLCHVK